MGIVTQIEDLDNSSTSTPGSVDFSTLPGFLFLAKVPVFSGLQPRGLQQVAKALVWQAEKITYGNFRIFPAFFRFENVHFDISRYNS
jgi:hypothetical protein